MNSPAERLDSISKTNKGTVPRSWNRVIPSDAPPMTPQELGNCGEGCVGIHPNQEGWIRAITRGQIVGARQQAGDFPLQWSNNAGNNFGLFLELGGVNYELILGLSVPDSIRIYAQAGITLEGEFIHILAHETDPIDIFALTTV